MNGPDTTKTMPTAPCRNTTVKSPNICAPPSPTNSRPSHTKPAPASLSSRALRSSQKKAPPVTTLVEMPTPTDPIMSPQPIAKEKKLIKKPVTHVHRLLASEVPSDVRGVQVCYSYNI